MYAAKYHKPTSVSDAVAALQSAEEGKILGGGQTLIPTMKQHLAAPSDLVDIRGIDGMSGFSVDGAALTIGAATAHADVAGSAEVLKHLPGRACLAAGSGDPAVRAMGTIGGSVANNDPAADYPAAVLGLGATVITDQREIAADDFFEGMFTTALEEGEVITSIRFPMAKRGAYAKFPNPASRYAIAGVFVAQTEDGVRVAVTGAGEDGVHRNAALEAALSSAFTADAVAEVAPNEDNMMSDIHASAAYRAHVVNVLAKRAVQAA